MRYLNLEKLRLEVPYAQPGVKIRRGTELLLIRTEHTVLQLGRNEIEVWDMLDGNQHLDDIISSLSRKYGVTETLVARSIEVFVDHLLEKRLLEPMSDSWCIPEVSNG